jgi:hypothetical protein
MEVLMKIGRYAGEIRDVRPDCAREMIADGRAEHPCSFETKLPNTSARNGETKTGKRRSRRS